MKSVKWRLFLINFFKIIAVKPKSNTVFHADAMYFFLNLRPEWSFIYSILYIMLNM
jgi:hypothetical protein